MSLYLLRQKKATISSVDSGLKSAGTLLVNYRAKNLTGYSNGATITSLVDASGNGYNSTSGNTSNLTYSVVSGSPTIYFNGTTSNVVPPSAVNLPSGPYSFYLYYFSPVYSSAAQRLIAGSSNYLIGPYGGNIQVYDGGGFITQSGSYDTNPHIQTVICNSSNAVTMWVDGVSIGSNTATNWPGAFGIGGVSGPYSEPCKVNVYAVVVYASDTTANRATIENLITTNI